MKPIAQESLRPCRTGPASVQRGAVLIVSLILLMVLTLLGVTSMTTTSLEEKMAANSQEVARAFQTAEAGIAYAFGDENSFDLSGYTPDTQPDLIEYSSSFNGWSPPPTGSLFSATSFQSANFDLRSAGTTEGGVYTILHRGAYQIAPRL